MDYVFLSTICAMTGTMFILLLYVYLYGVYREAYMGAWIIGWFIHFARIALFESGVIEWKSSGLYCIIYQILCILCGIALLYSAHLVVNKPLNKRWLYGAAVAFFFGLVFQMAQLSMLWKLLPATWIGSATLFGIGNIYINKFKITGVGNYITGYAFMLWGLLTAMIPVFADTVYTQWITLICGISRLIIAAGVLLVYFEKTRLDLISREMYYKGLADNSVDIVYHYRLFPENKVEYISPSVYLITGYTPEEFYSNPNLFENLIHPDDLWRVKTSMQNPSWPTDVPFDYRFIHKNKSIIYIEQNFITIYDKENRLTGRQGILRNVTARNNIVQSKMLYDQLNMVGKTGVSIAHQIRNPLTTIRGYLQLYKTKSVHEDNCNLMIEEIDKANSVISEYVLLALDKRADLKKCVLPVIIQSELSQLQIYAASSNVVIDTELEEVPQLDLDEREIRCMLTNLIRNGIDAMPGGGKVVLRVYSSEKEVILSISDQGSGIPENVLANLGTPFLTTKNTGTGLGLPISYRIAARNRAAIRVDSSPKGTTFFIHFSVPHAIE